jgi:hypothetical protein
MTVQHSQYACIGTATTLKQKQIKKIFPIMLAKCQESIEQRDGDDDSVRIKEAKPLMRSPSQASSVVDSMLDQSASK